MIYGIIGLVLTNAATILWYKLKVSRSEKRLSDAKKQILQLGHALDEREEALDKLEFDIKRSGDSGALANKEIAQLRASLSRCREPALVKPRLDAALRALQPKVPKEDL